MKRFLFLFTLIVAPVSFAVNIPEDRYIGPYYVAASARDASLDLNHAVFELEFPGLNAKGLNVTVEYSCNGVIRSFVVDSTLRTSVTVSPGKYKFMLVTNAEHEEIITDSIEIQPGFRSTVIFHFMQVVHEMVLKPVIYLYPTADQHVNVELQPKGAFTFTYPAYDKGWNGTAHPDGSMTINGKNYPYLFWEGEQQHLPNLADYSTGFVVEQENVTAFLEEKLTEMGLNAKEQTDFITFWGPKMAASDKGFAQFLFTEEYDNIATLNMTPAPDAVFRVYLLWTPLGDLELHPKPQTIQRLNRSGFTVVEWGGSELPFNAFFLSNN